MDTVLGWAQGFPGFLVLLVCWVWLGVSSFRPKKPVPVVVVEGTVVGETGSVPTDGPIDADFEEVIITPAPKKSAVETRLLVDERYTNPSPGDLIRWAKRNGNTSFVPFIALLDEGQKYDCTAEMRTGLEPMVHVNLTGDVVAWVNYRQKLCELAGVGKKSRVVA